MSSGRSSCERRRDFRTARPPAIRIVLALALALPTAGLGAVEEIPPPPGNPNAPRAPETTDRFAPTPKLIPCPRCGYLCEEGWHYCISCGWDRTVPVGDEEEKVLGTIARATVGLTVGGRPNRYSTAFPIGDSGMLVTNARVLIGASPLSLQVRTYHNRFHQTTIVGYDLPSGVGLLQAEIEDLPPIEIAPESAQPAGSFWAVCYPVAREDDLVRYLPVSFHRGRLTATGQVGAFYVSFENLLLTDHAIDDGCTGGPLIDSRGRLVGMILDSPEDGITYATPIEEIQPIVELLSRKESPVRPYFGFGLVRPDDRRRSRFDLAPGTTRPLIAYVINGSPAEQAGLRAGDILLAVAGEEVQAVREAGERLLAASPDGSALSLRIARDGTEREFTVQPISRPARVLLEPIDEIQESLEANLEEVPRGKGTPAGLRVADVVRGGRGEEARFKNGDIIVSVNKKSVKSFRAFNDLIRKKYEKIFAGGKGKSRLYSSSYLLVLGVRTAEQKKVTRQYVNLFPDFLAPPVY